MLSLPVFIKRVKLHIQVEVVVDKRQRALGIGISLAHHLRVVNGSFILFEKHHPVGKGKQPYAINVVPAECLATAENLG